jgi:hypothetical protein
MQRVARFLRAVGDGHLDEVRAALAANPSLVNAVGPHPYWGGRPQALHVSIETKRRDMFDLLLASGADINGSNEHYDHWSPLMLTVHWDQPDMRQILLDRGARVGFVEALLLEDDAQVGKLLSAGRTSPPDIEPNGGSLLAFARLAQIGDIQALEDIRMLDDDDSPFLTIYGGAVEGSGVEERRGGGRCRRR